MKKITHTWPVINEACEDQLEVFQELYPKGIPVCWVCLQKANQKGLDVGWLAYQLPFVREDFLITRVHKGARMRTFKKLSNQYGHTWGIYILREAGLKELERAMHNWNGE
jgi:hypothetical protein